MDSLFDDLRPMLEIKSLEYAIYFIVPPLLLYFAAYITADIFVVIGETKSERDIERDDAVTAMGVLIGIATIVAFLTHWFSRSVDTAAIVGSISFFMTAVIAYAVAIDGSSDEESDSEAELIEANTAIVLAGILTLCTAVPLALIVVLASRG